MEHEHASYHMKLARSKKSFIREAVQLSAKGTRLIFLSLFSLFHVNIKQQNLHIVQVFHLIYYFFSCHAYIFL